MMITENHHRDFSLLPGYYRNLPVIIFTTIGKFS